MLLDKLARQRLGKPLLLQQRNTLHDNEKIELFDKVFPSWYVKHYLKRVTGRLQTSEKGKTTFERKTGGVSKKGPVK
jgi:hypothetical protein